MFLGVGGKSGFWAKMAVLDKLQNMICVWNREKGIFGNAVCLGKVVLFQAFVKKKNTTKWGFQQARGKPKALFLFEKGCFGRGCLLFAIHKSCLLQKTPLYSVLNKTQLLQRKGYQFPKNIKHLTNIVDFV